MTKSSKSRVVRKIQNVRIVDNDEGTDAVKVSNILSQMSSSNSQIRVVCGYQAIFTPSPANQGIVAFSELVGTDDFSSFALQFKEFRVRAIQFRVFDIQPSQVVVNYWATFHTLGGTVGNEPDNIVDRPDSRIIAPGTGHIELNWVAHSQPEMEFQAVIASVNYGGLVYNFSPAAVNTATKYQVVAKFVVDFRGRV